MKILTDYTDKWNMIVTSEKDGGDSCAYGCALMYVDIIKAQAHIIPKDNYLNQLEVAPGRYCRHPDPAKWYSNPDTLSRDQMTPLLVLLGLTKDVPRLKRLFWSHLKRGLLFAWNTRMNGAAPGTPKYAWKFPDITGPEIWATWIRSFRLYPLYPLLVAFDVQTLIGAIQDRYFPSTTIQMNQTLLTDFSTRIMPTPTSLLARFIYGKKTPIAALDHEYGDATPFNPPVNQYLVPIVNEWKVRQ